MTGSKENLRNGQAAQFLAPQTEVCSGEKSSRGYFAMPFVIILVLTMVAFVGFLYYLEVRLNAEIRSYNEKVNRELKIYGENINAKLEEFDNEIKRLSSEIEEYRDKNKSPLQALQLGSDVMKFKGVAIQNMEEFPEIEDVQTDGLIDVSKNRTKNVTKPIIDESLEQINTTRSNDTEQIEEFRTKMSLFKPNVTEIPPDNILIDRDTQEVESTEGEDEEDDDDEVTLSKYYEKVRQSIMQQNRSRRSAEMADSGTINLIEKSPEVFGLDHRSNQTEFRKTSSSQNRTIARVDKIQCNGTPCEEPRKMPHLQKFASGRSSPMKKLTSTREASSPAALDAEDENIEINEPRQTVIAAHFGADSSKYSSSTPNYYYGNHHLRHPTGEYEDWKPSLWFDTLSMDKHFTLMNGNIKVHSSGLYFVYAQIFYVDHSDLNGFVVYLNSQEVLQCVTTTYSVKNGTNKANTCFTGGVIKCNAGDKISVRTPAPERRVMLEQSRSFVGLFKIGEFQLIK